MSCFLCKKNLKEPTISCSECHEIFNVYCICNHLKKDNTCPICKKDFISNENIFSLSEFKKFDIQKIDLIINTSDIIVENINNKIIQKNKIIKKLKSKKNKYKNLITVMLILINFVFYILIYILFYKLVI